MRYELDKNYNSLDRIGKWDAETQKIVRQRIANELGDALSYAFLTEREGGVLEFLVDALVPQEKNDKYIKIPEIIDHDLAKNIKGVRYGTNPWPREFYRQGLTETEKYAKGEFGKPIEDFSEDHLKSLIEKIFSLDSNDFLPKFLRRVLSDATAIYFSHPTSWNKIGFPGPAFPGGYPFLACGGKGEWEPKYDYEK